MFFLNFFRRRFRDKRNKARILPSRTRILNVSVASVQILAIALPFYTSIRSFIFERKILLSYNLISQIKDIPVESIADVAQSIRDKVNTVWISELLKLFFPIALMVLGEIRVRHHNSRLNRAIYLFKGSPSLDAIAEGRVIESMKSYRMNTSRFRSTLERLTHREAFRSEVYLRRRGTNKREPSVDHPLRQYGTFDRLFMVSQYSHAVGFFLIHLLPLSAKMGLGKVVSPYIWLEFVVPFYFTMKNIAKCLNSWLLHFTCDRLQYLYVIRNYRLPYRIRYHATVALMIDVVLSSVFLISEVLIKVGLGGSFPKNVVVLLKKVQIITYIGVLIPCIISALFAGPILLPFVDREMGYHAGYLDELVDEQEVPLWRPFGVHSITLGKYRADKQNFKFTYYDGLLPPIICSLGIIGFFAFFYIPEMYYVARSIDPLFVPLIAPVNVS